MNEDDVVDPEPEDGRNRLMPVPAQPLVPVADHGESVTAALAGRISPDGYLIALPPGQRLDQEAMRQLDLDMGYDPRAVEAAYDTRPRTYYEVLAILACILACAAILWKFFPWTHFFVPLPQGGKPGLELDLLTEKQVKALGDRASEEEKTRLELTRLMTQGKHEAIKGLCESRLSQVPKEQWEKWEKVWDFYLNALETTNDIPALREQSQRLLEANQDSLSARYYLAHVLLHFPRKGKYDGREAVNYKRDTERAVHWLQEAANRLDSAIQAARRTSGDIEPLRQKQRQYLVKLAEAHVKRWWTGGYQDGDVDDVSLHRDEALRILEQLGDWTPALQTRSQILRDIRKDWWTDYGSVFLKGRKRPKSDLVKELDEIDELLKRSQRAGDAKGP
jgi:hypothetical protein